MHTLEDLDVYNLSQSFSDTIWFMVEKWDNFPKFGMGKQITNSADSISSNIAEGTSRSSKVDFARFVEIATGSIFEVVSQSTVATRQGFLSEETRAQLYAAAEEQSRMLSGLRKALLNE